jgi:prepilin-type N-terminal cleavage/methylation domain-containing protein/prepilin-type processing-associated H-X9-DG protein
MYFAGRLTVRRGFTLIELLVVLAIITLLLAILLPGLRSAREQARQVKCGANLRNLGVGIHAYATSNRGYTCSGSFDPDLSKGRDGPVDEIGWVADLVNSRTGFPNEQLCPSNPARYNQKLGLDTRGRYDEQAARDLLRRGYNSNYTQSWYMARTEWNPGSRDYNLKRVSATFGPLALGRWLRVPEARIPLLADGRTDTDNLVLGERAVKNLSDGPYGGPYGTQNYADFGPSHGFGSWIFGGHKGHNRVRANVLFADGHVGVFDDKNRDGEFALNGDVMPAEQTDLNEALVFDGVLSIGRRSVESFELK